MLDRWNQNRGLIDESTLAEDLGLSLSEIRLALEELAYRVHRDSGTSAQAADIDAAALWRALNQHQPEDKPAREARIMGYLHQRSGILVAESEDLYRFPHRSYQEYLAACFQLRDVEFPARIGADVESDPVLWREVCLLAAGKAAPTPVLI